MISARKQPGCGRQEFPGGLEKIVAPVFPGVPAAFGSILAYETVIGRLLALLLSFFTITGVVDAIFLVYRLSLMALLHLDVTGRTAIIVVAHMQ